MQVQIGGQRVVDTANLIIPKNKTVLVEVVADGRRLKARIRFESTESGKKEATINVKPVDGEALITFSGWENPLGTATTQPFEVARFSESQALFCMAAHHRIGEVDKLDITFLLGS